MITAPLRRALALAPLLAVLAACGTAGTSHVAPTEAAATQSPTAAPTATPEPTPSPTPSPTPDPTPDLEALGEQFLALVDPGNRHICSYEESMGTDLARYTEYVRIVAENERTFTDALRQMAFPPDIQEHVNRRIEAGAALESVARLVAAAASFTEVNQLLPRMEEASFAARDASSLIRGDLGLPSSPTCDEVNS